jgi:hypothetical protein
MLRDDAAATEKMEWRISLTLDLPIGMNRRLGAAKTRPTRDLADLRLTQPGRNNQENLTSPEMPAPAIVPVARFSRCNYQSPFQPKKLRPWSRALAYNSGHAE